jgi:ribosomal protein S18
MKKNNALLSKAISEANTIKSGAIKNAHEILLETFSPKITEMFNQVVKEQVGVHNQDPMDGPDAKYNQLDGKTDVQNQEDDVNLHGDGPQLLEDEGLENADEDMTNEQDDMSTDDDMDFNFDDETDEQNDSFGDDDMEFEIEDDSNEQADDMGGDDDFNFDFDDEASEQDDSLDVDDTLDMSDSTDEQDDSIEIMDDEAPVEEQVEVSPETNPDVVKAANEAKAYKAKNAKLVAENRELSEGIEKLRKKIAQVNLFNAKVACANKITSNSSLQEGQKVKILEAFDNCKTLREVTMTYDNYKSLIKTISSRNKIQEARLRNSIKPNQQSRIEAERKETINEEMRKNLKLAGLLA